MPTIDAKLLHSPNLDLKRMDGRPPEILFGDTPMFAPGGSLSYATVPVTDTMSTEPEPESFWKDSTTLVFADLAPQLCFLQGSVKSAYSMVQWYGQEVAERCVETRRGIILVIEVREGVLRFHSPVGIELVVRGGDKEDTLRFDARNNPGFWCVVPTPEPVAYIEGMVAKPVWH